MVPVRVADAARHGGGRRSGAWSHCRAVSKSSYWANSLLLVVEDDAQDGVDHVDGHRTVALAIGPHVRRGAVDSNYYNHTSMVRTIQDIFEFRRAPDS